MEDKEWSTKKHGDSGEAFCKRAFPLRQGASPKIRNSRRGGRAFKGGNDMTDKSFDWSQREQGGGERVGCQKQ